MAGNRVELDGDRSAAPSVVTVVLRLLTRHLERGELIGHGEVVGTGAVADIRHPDDLVRLAAGNNELARPALGEPEMGDRT
jgi:hypothetical protein